jgi:hypothetical protein
MTSTVLPKAPSNNALAHPREQLQYVADSFPLGIIHLRTVTSRIDNVDFISFSMQMLVRLFQLLQEFVDALGFLMYASGFLDEAL